jgi:two-component system, cell cycle response regulator DivK
LWEPETGRMRPLTALCSAAGLRLLLRETSVSGGAARSKTTQPDAARAGVHRFGSEGPAPLVLVADDSEVTREMYSEFFVCSGLRVDQAIDGGHALSKARSIEPDLVIMDLAMPVIDGWDATRQIKSDPKTKHILVVALTGHVSPENLQRAHEAGADAVLTKPISPQELCALVQTLLDR